MAFFRSDPLDLKYLAGGIAALLAWMLFLGNAWASAPEVAEIREASYLVSESVTIPPADRQWKKVTLPHREPREGKERLTSYWYQFELKAGSRTEDVWLYFPKLRSGGTIYVNGVRIEDVRSADHTHQVRWFRPFLFYVPPATLHSGVNQVSVRFAIAEPLTSFGEVFVGPARILYERYDLALFWEVTSNRIAAFTCLLSSIFVLALWLKRRQETLYAMFGICLLFWGVRTFVFRISVVPLDWWLAWRFLYYLSTNGFIVFITLFLLRFSQSRATVVGPVLLSAWVGSLAAFLVVGSDLRPFMDSYGTLFYLPFTVYATVRLVGHAIRSRDSSAIAMVLAIAFALALALHDYAVQHGLFGVSEYYLLHLGIPCYLLVMGVILLNRFIASLDAIESMNATLSLKVAQRERELLASYEEMRRMQEGQARIEERQRIMQDIHDGVGSQLLTGLMLAKRGNIDAVTVAELLQACLDDMRLTIDSLAASTPDFAAALGNFRFRTVARFGALGIRLDWTHCDLPAWFAPSPSDTVKLLRILQEALANVLKHADAKLAGVAFDVSEEALRIRIEDDGKGFSGMVKAGGHGLNNMRSRAQSIGASFDVSTSPSGTSLTLHIPRAGRQPADAGGELDDALPIKQPA